MGKKRNDERKPVVLLDESKSIEKKPVTFLDNDTLEDTNAKILDIGGGTQVLGSDSGVKFDNFQRLKLDRGFQIGLSLDEHRARNQSNWDKFGNFIGRGILDGVIGQGIGSIGAVAGIAEVLYDKSVGNPLSDFDNFLLKWSRDIKESSKEALPIFRRKPGEAFDVSDFGWWAEGGVNVFSTLGLLIPGFAAGKATGKAFNTLANAVRLSTKNKATLTALAELGGGAIMQRNAEGFMESGQLAVETKKRLLGEWSTDPSKWQEATKSKAARELIEQGIEVTRENLATYVSAQAGWRAYNINSANIVFDVIQMAPLFRSTANLTKKFKLPQIRTNRKSLKPVANVVNKFGGTFLRQSTEGIEEGVNFIANEEGDFYGKRLLGEVPDTSVGVRAGEYLSDGHFWESAFWGVLGGIAFEGGSRGFRQLADKAGKAKDLVKQGDSLEEAVNKVVDDPDNREVQGQIKEIANRKALVEEGINKINAISRKDTYKDNITGETVDFGNLTDQQALEAVEDIKFGLGIELGKNAAVNDNFDSLLEQINSNEFQNSLVEEGFVQQEELAEATQELIKNATLGRDLVVKHKDSFNQIEDLKVRDKAIGKTVAIDVVREYLANTVNREETKEANDKLNNKSYTRLIAQNSAYETLLDSKALDQVGTKVDQFLTNYPNLIPNQEKVKEAIAKRAAEIKEELDKAIEGARPKPKDSEITSDLDGIIESKAHKLAVNFIDPQLARALDNIGKADSIAEFQEAVKKDIATQKKTQTDEVRDSIDSILETPISIEQKIAKIDNLKSILPPGIKTQGENIINKKLSELEFLKRQELEKDAPNQPTEPNEVVNEKPFEDVGSGTITTEEIDDVGKAVSAANIFEDPVQEEPAEVKEVETEEEIQTAEDLNVDNTIARVNKVQTEQGEPKPNNTQSESTVAEKTIVENELINEGATNIALARKPNELASRLGDTENLVIQSTDVINNVLKGKYKEGTKVNLVVNPEATQFADPTDAQTIQVEIRDQDNQLIGFLNSLPSKRNFFNQEKDRLQKEGYIEIDDRFLQDKPEQARIQKKAYLDSIREEGKKLKELREHLFQQHTSFPSSPVSTTIVKLSSGSIINLEDNVTLDESFGEQDRVLYKTSAVSNTTLEAPNREDVSDFFRNADQDSILNNIDSVYTPGSFYTLVDSPNGQQFPVMLFPSNLNINYATRSYEAIKEIISLINDRGSLPSSKEVTDVKDFLNQITYVGKNNIEVFRNEIKLTYPDGVTKLFFNNRNKVSGEIQLNIQRGIIDEAGKFQKKQSVFNDVSKVDEIMLQDLQKLIHNPNKNLVNTNEEYFSPLDKNFNNVPNEGAIPYSNYYSYLNKGKVLMSNIGNIKDEGGNIVSNFSIKGKSNLVLGVDTSIPQLRVKPQAQKVIESNNSIVNKKFTNFETYIKEIGIVDSPFNNLFQYADKKGFKLKVSTKVANGRLAEFDRKTNTILLNKTTLALRERGTNIIPLMEEILAHEIVHGFLVKEVINEKALNDALLNFINSIKKKAETAPIGIKNRLSYINSNSPQEVVALGFTNKEFSSWLGTLRAKNAKGESTTLLSELKDIIKKLLEVVLGSTKLDQLDKIVSDNINDKVKASKKGDNTDFNDILDDVLGFPDFTEEVEVNPEDSLTNEELNESADLVAAYFIRVREKLPSLNEEGYKNGLFNTLNNHALKPEYKAKANMNKVLNNFDRVWELTKFKLRKDQGIFFKEEENLEREFSLDKDFEDEGVLSRNVKDNIPTLVKDEIRKTPIIKDIKTELEGKDRYVYSKDNFLQLPQFLNFDLTYPYLQDKLSGISTSQELLTELENLSQYQPSFLYIKESIQNNEQILSAFTSHFLKQKADYVVDLVTNVDEAIEYNSRLSNRNNPVTILADNWKNNIVNRLTSNSYDKNSLALKIQALKRLQKDFGKNRESIVDTTVELMEEIGISIKNDVPLSAIIFRELSNTENLDKFKSESNTFSKLFFKPLSFIEANINKDQFDNYKDLSSIGKTLDKHIIIPVENVLLNIEGKPLYSITLPNFLSKTFNKFKNETQLKNLISLYNKVPALQNSNWVQFMGEVNEKGEVKINNKFFEQFNYYIEDGLKSREYQAGTKYSNMSNEEWDVVNALKYLKDIDKAFVGVPALIPADSSNMYYLNVPKFEFNYNKDNKIVSDSPGYIAIKNIALQEIEAMKQARDLMFDVNPTSGEIILKENLDESKLQLHYHYKLDSNNNKIFIENGQPTGNVFKFQAIPALNDIPLRFNGVISNNYREQIRDFNQTIGNFIVDTTKETINNINFAKDKIKPLVESKGYTWEKFVTEFAMNSFIANTEMSNLFHGNISEYKNSIDIGKRLKQVLTPGLAQSDVFGTTFKAVTIADVIQESESIESLSNSVVDNLRKRVKYNRVENEYNVDNILNKSPQSRIEKDVFNIIEPYFKVNVTDAQGYITLDRFRQIVGNEGRLTPSLNNIITRLSKGERINREELTDVLEPVKGFFYDRFYDNDLNKFVSKQIKYSTIPLIPQLIEGTYLEDVQKTMASKGIDEIVYESASKVGTREISKIHNEDGSINTEVLNTLEGESFDNSNWQRQLDVPDKIEDQEKLLAVQISRLIFGNDTANKPLFKRYSELIGESIEQEAIKLLQDIGYSSNEEGQLVLSDPTKLQNSFIEEIESRNLPNVYKQGVEFQEGSTKFKLPLSISALSSKYQSIFLSKFTKAITDQKLPGFSSVQFSSAFMQQKSDTDVGILSDNIIDSKDQKEPLQFVKSENGFTAEILVSPYDSRFFKRGKIVNINDLSEDARTLIGYRIPTDALHSMITLKVVGFLPRESSSTMVVPKEITTQMGSDFDVDKLFIAKYNIDNKFNKIVGADKKGRQNEIVDIFRSILTSPKHVADLIKPSEFTNFEEIAKTVDNLYQRSDANINVLTYLGQKDLRAKNLSGKALTGISANFNSFAYIAQESAMEIDSDIFNLEVTYNKNDIANNYRELYAGNIVSDQGDTVTIRHTKLGNNNQGTFTNVKGQLITDIIGESLASAVDTVKQPLHPKINSNTFTFPAIATMLLIGIDVNTAGLFSSQPIIRLLGRKSFEAKSVLTNGRTNYVEETRKIYEESLLKLLGRKRKVYNKLKLKSLEEASEYIGYNLGESTPISSVTLTKAIKDFISYNSLPKADKIVYLQEQLRVLENYNNLSNLTREVNNLIGVTKVDNLGAGPTTSVTVDLMNKLDKVDKVEEDQQIGIIKIDETNAVRKIYPRYFGSEEASVYSPLEQYLDNSNLLSLNAASPLFIESSPYIREYINSTIEQFSIPSNINNINKISKAVITQLIGKTEKLRQTDYSNLIKGDNSVGKQLNAVLNNPKYTELVNDGTNILNRLSVELTEDFDAVNFKNTNDSILVDFLSESITKMYKSGDPTLNSLVESLFRYSFINNGLNFNSNSLASIFPVELYEEFGVVSSLEDSHSQSLVYDINTLDPNARDIIARNNWRDRNIVPKVNKRQATKFANGIIGVSKSNNFISNKIKNASYLYFPEYRKATKQELQANPGVKYVLESDFIYNRVYEIDEQILFIPVPKLGVAGKYIDVYDNIDSQSKKDIEALNLPYSNTDEAIDFIEENFSTGTEPTTVKEESLIQEDQLEDASITREKINTLSEAFRNAGVKVEIAVDYDIDANAQIETIEGETVITLNPSRVFNDTVIHEFGHLYVDMIGYNSPQIQFGIDQLRDSNLFKQVSEVYPELSGERLEKEVLVTAIGREGAKIFNDQKRESRFKRWLNRLWNRVANLLGLSSPNVAQILAKEMLDAKLQRNLQGKPSVKIQKSKSLEVPNNVKDFISKRIIDIEKQITRFSKDTDFKRSSERLVDELSNLNTTEAIIEINSYLKKRIKNIDKRIEGVRQAGNPSSESFTKLYNASVIINSFNDLIDLDISNITTENSDGKALKNALVELRKQVNDLTEVEAKLNGVAKDMFRQKLLPLTSNPEVLNKSLDIFDAQFDENGAQRMLDALADTNNTFVALMLKDVNVELDKKNNDVRRTTRRWDLEVNKLKEFDIDFTEFFELDQAGNKTGKLLTEFDTFAYAESKDQLWNQINKLRSKRTVNKAQSKEVKKAINKLQNEWFENNQQVVDNADAIESQRKAELSDREYRQWRNSNIRIVGGKVIFDGELGRPSDKYKSKRFKELMEDNSPRGIAKREFYNYFKDLMLDLVENSNTEFIEKGYLPAVPVDTRSYMKTIKEDVLRLKNKENVSSDDTKMVYVDENGKVVSVLFMPYIKRLKQLEVPELDLKGLTEQEAKDLIDNRDNIIKANRRLHAEALNYNMEAVIPEFIKSSKNFQVKKELENQVLLTQEVLSRQKILEGNSIYDQTASKVLGKNVSNKVDAKNANVSKHLDDWVKMVFFDDFNADESQTLVNVSDAILNWSSLTGIGFNVFSGINNKAFGTIQNSIEAAGGAFFDKKAYRKARKDYNSGILSYLGGRNNRESTTLEEGLIKEFDIYVSQKELAGQQGGPIQTKLDKFKIATDAAYAMQTLGEHSMQNVGLFAMMNSHRIVDGKLMNFSQFIDSKTQQILPGATEEQIDAIIERNKKIRLEGKEVFESNPTLYESYEFEDGFVKLKDGVNLSEEQISLFRQKTISVNQMLHGIYTKEDAGAIQQYALGRLAVQFRKWMRPGWNKRFGSKFGKTFWNERREAPDEGMYITTYNFIKELVKDYKKLGTAYKLNWNNLSEFQKGNVKRTAVEMGFLLGSIMLLTLARALADDDEELKENRAFNMLVYQLDRTRLELATYIPAYGWFNEGLKLQRSPVAGFRLFDDTMKLGRDILMFPFRTEEEREYRSGVRYGEDKVATGIKDLLPLINQAERVKNINENNEFYKLF